jgi:ribosomal protein RSM22 (predicted rRNA methylase)
MEKNNIIFSSHLIDDSTMSPILWAILYFKETGKFYEFKMKISAEFRQDLGGIYKGRESDILLELINDYPENSKEISIEYLQNQIDDPSTKLRDDLNKALIPYIRHEKLNKLIN